MLRSSINLLARICGYLAALFLAGIAIATFAQIVARQMGTPIETTELSGFFLAASTFLGLAYTFVNGVHVRIGLVSEFAPKTMRRAVELWACLAGALIIGYAAYHMTRFTVESYRFGDLSPGFIAVPLWIPQSAVSFGLGVMLLSMIEQLTLVASGRVPDYETNKDSTVE
ncbi:TRAP transporter small permease [Sulfitobacter sp. R18_1]|uniref:TRAP transporter small permease n=1 Tax=Sulfitobacter sp. R18_1 TaxID=2821104 RepID=UPI001ADCDD2E|nr:TRAP transporter small permease [Sulfitobacter sp. R18_1]MBO9429675.1 TRAP transporter small permease subunit [Sulfitobacter sp. R18_1]